MKIVMKFIRKENTGKKIVETVTEVEIPLLKSATVEDMEQMLKFEQIINANSEVRAHINLETE